MIVGPDGYFKIVVDSFDGTAIQAWHVEGPDGSKSPNLAVQNNGAHLDAIVNTANGTVRAFYNGMAAERLTQYLPKADENTK